MTKKLFQEIISIDNLVQAFDEASRCKRFRKSVLFFNKNISKNIISLHSELLQKKYRHGNYKFFTIHDQKERRISAAPFRDRVIHHAVCQIIEPFFENNFISDSYANRKNKGTHRAIEKLQKNLAELTRERERERERAKKVYCLKCDISKCFPSINQQILLTMIRCKINCHETLQLIEKIIRSFETGNEFDNLFHLNSPFRQKRPRGIPIGNLTSQLFVNIYLDRLDQFVKNDLREKYYIRYVDDFLILHRDKKHLHKIKNRIIYFLKKELYMEMHPKKQRVFPVNQGIDFLGYVIFEKFRLLRKSNKVSFRKKLLKIEKLYKQNLIKKEKVMAFITSWLAHTEHANTYRLRKRIFGEPITAKDQEKISYFIDSWKNKPAREPSGQLRLF